ncbi:acyltransferase family protein [Streptococcaceae bacterium ESL0729]|nr:acyltransferase family protein [Streptococcaceae bacterium ESL0729]
MKNNKISWFSLIRVLGLVMVLFYHFFKNLLPGGFIGVDIFFVFSGYLITCLALRELLEDNNFQLVSYLKRRFLRIYPPLLLMVVTTLPLSLLLPGEYRANIGNQAMAALGFVTNIFEIKSGSSYESQFFPHFYVHTWTLSLEFLFYLTFGLGFWFLTSLLKKKKKGGKILNEMKFMILLVSIIGILVSIISLQVSYDPANPSATYYGGLSHFYPFFIGSLTAVFYGIHLTEGQKKSIAKFNRKKVFLLMLASIGGLIILAKTLTFATTFTFRGGLILTSFLTALLIITTRILNLLGKERKFTFFSYLADISYSVYLWHWPLWIVISYFLKSELLAGLVSLLVTVAISTFVYYFVEAWIHGKKLEQFLSLWKKPVLRYVSLASLTLILVGDVFTAVTAKPISDLEASVNAGELVQTTNKIKDIGRAGIQLDTIFSSIYQTSDFNNPASGLISDTEIVEKNAKYSDYAIASSDIKGGVTLIGDSVMLGDAQELSDNIPGALVDARVSRNYKAGEELFESLLKEGKLGKYVVIGLGTNPMGGSEPEYINKIIDALPEGSRLVFIIPYNAKNPTDVLINTQNYLRSLPEKYDFVTIYDWPDDAKNYINELEDGIHLVYGKNLRRVYTSGLIKSLNKAASQPAK